MALSTFAKPPKNFCEVSNSSMESNSSKLAPAQKAFSPRDFNKIALTEASRPASKIVFASSSRISPGLYWLLGCPKVISAILFFISCCTVPLFI